MAERTLRYKILKYWNVPIYVSSILAGYLRCTLYWRLVKFTCLQHSSDLLKEISFYCKCRRVKFPFFWDIFHLSDSAKNLYKNNNNINGDTERAQCSVLSQCDSQDVGKHSAEHRSKLLASTTESCPHRMLIRCASNVLCFTPGFDYSISLILERVLSFQVTWRNLTVIAKTIDWPQIEANQNHLYGCENENITRLLMGERVLLLTNYVLFFLLGSATSNLCWHNGNFTP